MTSAERPGAARPTASCSPATTWPTPRRWAAWRPPPLDTPHGLLTFGAQFAEVAVDPELGPRPRAAAGRRVRPGRVLNPLLARSQLMGGMLWGLGQALLEGNRMDPRYGRWAASNLAEYLVPVNADAPDVTVEFVEVHDEVVSPLGVKGVGEIGQVGAAAAIANAVFHATGRRVRELPMAPELVMDPPRRADDASEARRGASGAAADLRARPPGATSAESRPAAARPAGLLLVVPVAALLAVGAGGAEPSLLVLGPLVTFVAPARRDGRVLVGGLAGHAAAGGLVGLGRHRADRRRAASC